MTGPLLFCGDPHGQWQHIIDAALQTNARAVILLGDLEPARPLHIELAAIRERVWYVHGNHDTDHADNFANVWHSELADRNIHGRVVTLPCGTRMGGLGGIFRGAVWYPKDPQAPKFRNREEHKDIPHNVRYLSPIQMGVGTSFTKFLIAMHEGSVIYDPAPKIETPNSKGVTKVHPRSQFRTSVKKLAPLYDVFNSQQI